ncbi:MAG: hypothetical protein U5K51_07270 [Flavobacteriaceae bacterium]|nr:hypothetical protein [Flavobacteriaceae bacterium]
MRLMGLIVMVIAVEFSSAA